MSFYGDEAPTDATETRRKYTQAWADKLEPYEFAKRNDLRAKDALQDNVWFYRDRVGTIRGPAHLHTLRQCWVSGIVDEHTMMWGNGLSDWVPARNVRGLIPLIRNPPTVFMHWIMRKFVDTDAKLAATRAERHARGLAKSDTLTAEGFDKLEKKRARELRAKSEAEAGAGRFLGSLSSRAARRFSARVDIV